VTVKTGIVVGMDVLVGSMVGTIEEVGVSTEVLIAVDLTRLSDGKQAVSNNTRMRVAKLFFIKCIL
jgi:hypothetical protein